MTLVLILLAVQGVLGAIDTLWHHEATARLASQPSARGELALHALRAGLYAVVFLTLPWVDWRGPWALALAAILLAELFITLKDFLVEDLTRRLPPSERVLHTLMAIVYGAFLAVLAPVLGEWLRNDLKQSIYRDLSLSWAVTALGIGVLAWAIRDGLAALKPTPPWPAPTIPSGRTVLIGGATGFIGAALVRRRVARGDRVLVVVRDDLAARARWPRGVTVLSSLDDLPAETRIDGMVNLAGAPVIAGPWTRGRRWALLQSRLQPTDAILRLIARLEARPPVLVTASAVGFYGHRAGERLADDAPAGKGFMADLCRLWEDEALKAEALGVRVCRLRLGMVFDNAGGPLPMLALPVRFGMGAVLGGGRQWAPWIALEDVLRLIDAALDDARYDGPVNAVAPDLMTQGEMTRGLAWLLGRPQWLGVPAWPLRLLLGEMSDIFLASQRVEPRRLQALGFVWAKPTLAEVLDPGERATSYFPAAVSASISSGTATL